jgi:hypothetical protein
MRARSLIGMLAFLYVFFFLLLPLSLNGIVKKRFRVIKNAVETHDKVSAYVNSSNHNFPLHKQTTTFVKPTSLLVGRSLSFILSRQQSTIDHLVLACCILHNMLLDYDKLDAASKGWLAEVDEVDDDSALEQEENRHRAADPASELHRRLIDIRVAQRLHEQQQASRVVSGVCDDTASDENSESETEGEESDAGVAVGAAPCKPWALQMSQQKNLWNTRRLELIQHFDIAWRKKEVTWLT